MKGEGKEKGSNERRNVFIKEGRTHLMNKGKVSREGGHNLVLEEGRMDRQNGGKDHLKD